MATYIQPMAEKFNMQRAKKLRWQKAVTAMAAVVVFCTTYALIIPALTWERTLICEKTEHTHTEACYETVEIPAATKLSCGKEEHQHSDACLGEVRTLVCSQTECEAHQHDESCYTEETYLTCTDEDPEHIHDESCYAARTVLTCGKEETEGHTHGESCYVTEIGYICGLEEHAHDESCSTEVPAHTEEILVCGLEEHAHTDDCFDAPPAPEDEGYYCGHIAHVHDESCYFEEGGALKCTLEEHEHTKLCESNPNADRERERDWIASFDDAVLRSNWAKNTIAIAETQIGYKESTKNFIVTEDGKPMGYTRYGAWYGGEYGDWCAMFCSFCLHYAGVDTELMPVEESCHRWVEMLQDEEYDLYRPAEEYTPAPGDLVFFDWDEFDPEDEEAVAARSADHVGFVYEVIGATEEMPAMLRTIEGNSGNAVCVNEYKLTDTRILGYAELPENPDDDVRTLCFEGEDYHIAVSYTAEAAIPEEAELTVREILPGSAEFDSYYDQMIDPQQTNSVKFIRLFDICFVVDGEEFEPSAPVDVNITYDEELPYVEEEDECQTIHFADSGMESLDTEITVSEDGQSTLAFTQESFSVTATVVKTKVEGVFYQRVTSLDEINGTDKYLIVSVEGNQMLNGDSTNNYGVALTPVKSYPDHYTVTRTDGNAIGDSSCWKFSNRSKSGTNVTANITSQGNTKYKFRLNNDTFLSSGYNSSKAVLEYQESSGTWTIHDSNSTSYYLWNENGAFSRSNTETQNKTDVTYRRNVLILKEVNKTLDIPEIVEDGTGGSGSGGTETYPGDLTVKTPSGAKTGTGAYGSGMTMAYASDPGTSDIEKQFVGKGVRSEIDLKAISATVEGNYGERYPQLFDGNTGTKYCAACTNVDTVEVVFETGDGSKQTVTDYTVTTANDHEKYSGRLPKGWKLYGSNDQSSWSLIDTVSDPGMEEINYKEYTYDIDAAGSYQKYKIVFDVQGVNTLQLSEIKFYTDSAAANDGKILADKSVLYGDNDYYSFGSYAPDEFSVTLSALAQQYRVTGSETEYTPVDVVLVLDISGSMKQVVGGQTRAETVTIATNTLIEKIMSYHPDNRVGIVTFSNSSKELLPLNRYYVGNQSTTINYNKTTPYEYLKCDATDNSITISTNENLRYAGGKNRFNGGTPLSREVVGGTYTQQGIAQGAGVFDDVTDTTVTLSSGDTVARTPLMILVSDGEPTICTSNYMDPLAGPHYGNGVASNTNNDKGVLGYYTILTANYFKSMISVHYSNLAKIYTIGMGILQTGTGNAATASQTVTGDHYKRAVLNPSEENINTLLNETGAKNYDVTAKQLADLLSDSYSGSSITISSASDNGIITALGRTNTVVPVLKNPYKSGYSYADGAYFKEDYDPAALIAVFDSIIKNSMLLHEYSTGIQKKTDLTIVDTVGDGMQLTSAPVLRYGNKTYQPTPSTASGSGTTTYTYSGTVTPATYAGSESLSQITVTVSGTPGAGQKITWNIPADLVPEFTAAQTADWYYPQYPARLLFKVGLTDDAKAELEGLKENETRTYYTNSMEAAANAEYTPSDNNPYYQTDRSTALNKAENTTETAATYFESTHESGTVTVALGNNGKLIFCSNAPELVSITIKKVDMNGNIIASSAEFEVYGDAALTDKIGTYTTANGEVAIEDLTIGTTYYLVETKAPDGYNILPGPRAFLVNADGEIGEPSESGGYKAFQGDAYLYTDGSTFVLYVRNSNGYELPETGGIGTNTIYTLGASLTAGALMYGCILRRKRERRAY